MHTTRPISCLISKSHCISERWRSLLLSCFSIVSLQSESFVHLFCLHCFALSDFSHCLQTQAMQCMQIRIDGKCLGPIRHALNLRYSGIVALAVSAFTCYKYVESTVRAEISCS